MSEPSENISKRGWIDEFSVEFREVWHRFPDKAFFFALLGFWLLLFHLVGNPTFGYRDIKSPSLLYWMHYAYTNAGSEDGHGLLIPLVVLGLFWWKRKELMEIPKMWWWPGLLGLLAGLLLHLGGYYVQQHRFSVIGLFVGIYSLMALVWGRRFAAASFFPFILFAFCIPVGTMVESVTLPLRQISADIAVGVTRTVLGIDVIQDGVRIMDAKGAYQYEVAAACSGIRSLISLSALTTIYGFVTFRSWWKRGLFVVIAVPLAIIGNVLRLTAIIVGTEAFNTAVGMFIHDWFGFVTFILALGAVFWLGGWLRENIEISDNGPQLAPKSV